MFNELINNIKKLGIITANDVERLTATELMFLIIERLNGLFNHLKDVEVINNDEHQKLSQTIKNLEDELKSKIKDNESYFEMVIQNNLTHIAVDKLNGWLLDGTLEGLINQTALNGISSRVQKLETWKRKYQDETNNSLTVLQKGNDLNVAYYRIPWMTVTKNGTIIVGADARYNNGGDQSFIDLAYKRSTDGGATWSSPKIAIANDRTDLTYSRVMDGTILCDPHDNKIYVLGNQWKTGSQNWTQTTTPLDSNWDVLLATSTDDGESFNTPISLKNLAPSTVSQWIGGVGSGIVLSNGTLVFPIQVSFCEKVVTGSYQTKSGIIYSTNHGATWQMSSSFVDGPSSECTIVEIDGGILLNARSDNNKNRRLFFTNNLGATWTPKRELSENTPQYNACQGHMIKLPYKSWREDEAVLFSHPSGLGRNKLSVSVLNGARNKFNGIGMVHPWNFDGYSCMAYDSNRDELYIVYEAEGNILFENISYILKNINLSMSQEFISEKGKANVPGEESNSVVTFYVGGSKYGSNENDGLSWDKALKDFRRIPDLIKHGVQSIRIEVHEEYDQDFFLFNIPVMCEVTGRSTNNIPCKRLYVRNCQFVKFTRGINITQPFTSDYLMAFEGGSIGINVINIASHLSSNYLVYADGVKLSVGTINFDDTLKPVDATRATSYNNLIMFFSRPSDVSLNFNMSKFIPFRYTGGLHSGTGSSHNRLMVNDLPSNDDSISDTQFTFTHPVDLTITGPECRVTDLNESLSQSTGGLPSTFVRNDMVTINADVVINNMANITKTTPLFNIKPIYRPKNTRFLTGIVGKVELGQMTATYNMMFKIDSTGNVYMINTLPSNDVNVILLYGTYSLL